MEALSPTLPPHAFDRIEILCPDDRWHSCLDGALQIRVFGGVARRPDALDTLRGLQARFASEPGVLTVNIRRHPDCGFRLAPYETAEILSRRMSEITGREPMNLAVFSDPAVDLLEDLACLRELPWLPGTVFYAYVTEFATFDSQLVDQYRVP